MSEKNKDVKTGDVDETADAIANEKSNSEKPNITDAPQHEEHLNMALLGKSATLRDVYLKVSDDTGIKIHLFGNTSFDLLANAPLHSCDSAMWARAGGWGNIRYWNPLKEGENKTDRIYMEEYIQTDKTDGITFSTYEYKKEFEEYLWNTFNLEYYDLIGSDRAVNKMLVNTHYFVQFEKIITDIHRKKGFNTDE